MEFYYKIKLYGYIGLMLMYIIAAVAYIATIDKK